jgi:hypothetical protein
MPQPHVNSQTPPKPKAPTFNPIHQSHPPRQVLTEDQVKKVVTEVLIAFDLIPKAQKKKGIKIE